MSSTDKEMTFDDLPLVSEDFWSFLQRFGGMPEDYALDYIEEMSSRTGHHGIGHILFMLKLLKEVPIGLVHNLKLLTLAIIYHDIVYNPGSETNEEESCSCFEDSVTLHSGEPMSVKDIAYVRVLIKQAAKEMPGTDSIVYDDAMLLHDLDYAILGANWQSYLEYMMGIWAEYGKKYGIKKYIQGRLEFLQGILKKEIFFNNWFKEKFGKAVAENVEREIGILSVDFH